MAMSNPEEDAKMAEEGMEDYLTLIKERGRTTIVCPLTTNLKRLYSFEARITPSKVNGLSEVSKLMLRQLRVIDEKRIHKRLGRLEEKYHHAIRQSLVILFDIDGDF